jgi:hypothetical protein
MACRFFSLTWVQYSVFVSVVVLLSSNLYNNLNKANKPTKIVGWQRFWLQCLASLAFRRRMGLAAVFRFGAMKGRGGEVGAGFHE